MRLAFAVLALLAALSAADFPEPGIVARWIATDGTDSQGGSLIDGANIAALPSATSQFGMTTAGTGPSYATLARGCHASMEFDNYDSLVTDDPTSQLDPADNEWLFFAVGMQTGTRYGSVMNRYGSSSRSEGIVRLQRGLAYTITAALFNNYNYSFGSIRSGTSKASDVLNQWSTWMVHLTANKARAAQHRWVITYYDNNDDSASSAAGISGYLSGEIDGGIRAPSVPFALGGGGGFSSFTGALLEAGVVRGTGINRTRIQTFLDDRYHLTCQPIAPPGTDIASQVTTPAVQGRDDRCSQHGSPSARDGSSCTQTCSGRANRVAGTSGHVCQLGSWSGAPIVCESTCPQLTAPDSASMCYQVAYALAFSPAETGGASGYSGLLQGPLRQLAIQPPLPPSLRSTLWSVDSTRQVVVTRAVETCDTSVLPSLLTHTEPLWASFLSASTAVSIDATIAFEASSSGTGMLGVATRVRDVNNYYRLVVTLNYAPSDPGTDPASALNATVALESVKSGIASSITTGAVAGSMFNGTKPLRLRLWVKQATLTAYVGPRMDYPSASPTDAPSAYGFGPQAGAGDVVSPVSQSGAGSVPTSDPAGWESFRATATSLTHGEATAALVSAGSGWFDDLVVGTDCQAGRACQFGSSTMQCVHGCSPGYRRANGTEVRSCTPGSPGVDGAWSGEALRCIPLPPSMPAGLEPFTIPENSVLDTPVGTPLSEVVTANSTDVAILFSFEGTGHIVNGVSVFKVSGCSGQIFVANGGSSNLDYEGPNSQFILKVVATPNGEASAAARFDIVVQVTDVDEAPILVSPANRSIIETAAPGTPIGLPLEWSDPDCPDTNNCDNPPVFSIQSGEPQGWQTSGPGGTPAIALSNTSGQLVVGGGLDFEQTPTYKLSVRASSPLDASLFSTATVTVIVQDGPDAPFVPADQTPLTVGEADVSEGSLMGGPGSGSFTCGNVSAQSAAFGSFFACDPDAGDTVTYSLVEMYDVLQKAPVIGDVLRVGSASGAVTWGPDVPSDLGSVEPSIVEGVSVSFAVRMTIRVTDNTALSSTGEILAMVLANTTARPLLSDLRVEDKNGFFRTVVPPDGGEYKLIFTGSGFQGPGVIAVSGGQCVIQDTTTFKDPAPVMLENCTVLSDTSAECPAPAGAGQGLGCTLTFTLSDSQGTRDVNAVVTSSQVSFNYQSPRLTGVCSGTWPTKGGGTCRLQGIGFGYDTSIIVVDIGSYGSSSTPESDKYEFSVEVVEAGGDYIIVNRPELYGFQLYFRINVGGGLWSSSWPNSQVTPMEITGISGYGSSVDSQSLDTYSRPYIEIKGENFGPYRTTSGGVMYLTGCLSTARYSSIYTTCSETNTRMRMFGAPYSTSTQCYKDSSQPHNLVRCRAPQWAGYQLDLHICSPQPSGSTIRCSRSSVWTVPQPVPGLPSAKNTVTFTKPSISSLNAPRTAATEGGEKVTVQGYDFGPVDYESASAVYYHPSYPSAVLTASCTVTVQSISFSWFRRPGAMECLMAPMRPSNQLPLATDHVWEANIGGQRSDAFCCSSYGPPILSMINGEGAVDAVTTGGQDVIISGRNFGPLNNPINVYFYLDLDLEADGSSGPGGSSLNGTSDIIVVGDGTGGFKVQPAGGAAACRVTTAHTEVTCVTPQAAGSQLRWEVVAYNRSSVPPLTAYALPAITAVLQEDTLQPVTAANPDGGDRIVIMGENFGPPQPPFGLGFEQGVRTGPMLQWVRYGSPGRWRAMTNISVTNHTEIHATLGPGIGTEQEVVVEVGGQTSILGSDGAKFSFLPPKLVNVTQVRGPPVPTNARSGNAQDAFRIQGTVTQVPAGFAIRVSFGNEADNSVIAGIPSTVSFDNEQSSGDNEPGLRSASFEFSLPAGAGLRRIIQADVVDPNVPAASAAVRADGACTFDYYDPQITSFRLNLVDVLDIPQDVFNNFRATSNVFEVTMVGQFLSDPALDAASGSSVARDLLVNASGVWQTQLDADGKTFIYLISWTDTEIKAYVNLDRQPGLALRARITSQYPSDAPPQGSCSAGNPGGQTSSPMATEQSADMFVTRSRPGVSGIVGMPVGGFSTEGGEKVQVQVLGTELFKATTLHVSVRPTALSTAVSSCDVKDITATAGSWGDASWSPTLPTIGSAELVDYAQTQCAAYWGVSKAAVGSLSPSQPCSLFCVSPEGQGAEAELGLRVDEEPEFGGATAFPYARPTVGTVAAGVCENLNNPVIGSAVQASSTVPGAANAHAIVVPSGGTGLLRIQGSNFGTQPEVWFFADNPNGDRVASYVRSPRPSDPCESVSHTELVVRVPNGWGSSRGVWVRAPPGEEQVGEQPLYFNYRPPSVSSSCIIDSTTRACATTPDKQVAKAGATLRVYFDSVGAPLQLSSSAVAQYMPMSVVLRAGAPTSSAQTGLTATNFCGKPPVDPDGHRPVQCIVPGAPFTDQNGSPCPDSPSPADPHAVVAQRISRSTWTLQLSSPYVDCVLNEGAGAGMEAQVAIGEEVSGVFGEPGVIGGGGGNRRRTSTSTSTSTKTTGEARELQAASMQVSYAAPRITSGFTMPYDPSALATSLQAVKDASTARGSSPGSLANFVPGPMISSRAASAQAAVHGPTTGGYLAVIEGEGFGRNYAEPASPYLAAASRAGGDVPFSLFTGSPPQVGRKQSCVFASANWTFTRTPGNSLVKPSCNGAEDYQGEGEASDATYLSNEMDWRSAMVPSGQTEDVFSPIVLFWSDTAVAVRVPPGAGGFLLRVEARGRLSNPLDFLFDRPQVEAIRVTAPTKVISSGFDANTATDLSAFFLQPNDFESDSPSDYVELPNAPSNSQVSTDGTQVIVIRGKNFGPVPPSPASYADMPPNNNSRAVPRPVSTRFPSYVVAVWGSGSCATGYYEWDARGFAATTQHKAAASTARYFGVSCKTRVLVPLAVVPGRIVSSRPLEERMTILSHSHDRIVMRAPSGVGMNRNLQVVVHSYEVPSTPPVPPQAVSPLSNGSSLTYMPPLPKFTADPNIHITDADKFTSPIVVFGRSMGRQEDQPPDLSILTPGTPSYISAAARRADGGWDEGGSARDGASGSVEVQLGGRPCLQPVSRAPMASTLVESTAIGESGVVTALTCPESNTSLMPVGFTPVNIRVAGVRSSANFSVFVGCDNGFYGRVGESCLKCPFGGDCQGMVSRAVHTYPVARNGYYDLGQDRFNLVNPQTGSAVDSMQWLRSVCPPAQDPANVARGVCIVPCFPNSACLGDNQCSPAYSSVPQDFVAKPGELWPSTFKYRCAYCARGFYRRTTDCEPCPDSPLLLIILFVIAVMAAAGLGLFLSSKNINVALLNTGVDTFQVLALFSSARISWPPEIRTIFELLSTFNLNLEITAPECLVPSLTYEGKWWMVMTVPILTFSALLLLFFGYACFKRFIKGQRGRRKFFSHLPKLVSAFLVALYVYYVLVCRKVMDVFDCEPVPGIGDDSLYMAAGTLDKCGEPGGLQARLQPWAVIFLLFYVIGFPAVLLVSMYRNRFLIATDQLLRAKGMGWERHDNSNEGYQLRKMLGRVYFAYKPQIAWLWVQAILMRKLSISLTAVLFDNDSSFILTTMALVLIICYAVHVRHLPFMSPGDRPWVLRDHTRRVMEGEATSVRMQKVVEEIEARKRKSTHRVDWTDPTAAGGGMSTTRRSALALASSVLVDYNVVEGTMLFTTILVSLCGILLNTERFEGATYDGQREFITWCVILLIVGALVYFALVFAIDMHTGIQEAAVRRGKMRPEDVRPMCHRVMAAAGCSDLPVVELSKSSKGKGKANSKALREATRLAHLRGFDEEGAGASSIELTTTSAGSQSKSGSGSGATAGVLQSSSNPMFGIQGGAGALAGPDVEDSKSDAKAGGDGDDGDAAAASAASDDMMTSTSRVSSGGHMSELKRMTANVLSMTHPPSSTVWPDVQQLFADLASQVEAHTARTKLSQREREGQEASSTSSSSSAMAAAKAARRLLKHRPGTRKSFAQSRMGSRRKLGGGESTGVSMKELSNSRKHGGES